MGALLHADMAHISGFVATQMGPNVFDHCHIASTTTHKNLRGPRGALVFSHLKHGEKNLFNSINESCFPGIQSGPHNHTIGAICAALKEANSPEFKEYFQNIHKNACRLSTKLQEHGLNVFTGGTDHHILLVDLTNSGIDGGKFEFFLDRIGISVNKNTMKGDQNAFRPNGLRIGSSAMTTRGATESDFDKIAEFILPGSFYQNGKLFNIYDIINVTIS